MIFCKEFDGDRSAAVSMVSHIHDGEVLTLKMLVVYVWSLVELIGGKYRDG